MLKNRYKVGYIDGGQAGATLEATSSQTRYRVGDGDGGQVGTFIEAKFSQVRYLIQSSIYADSFRDNYISSVFVIICIIIFSLIGYTRSLVLFIEIIVNTIYFYIMSPHRAKAEAEDK